jgi:hypothetical protein
MQNFEQLESTFSASAWYGLHPFIFHLELAMGER